MSLRKREYCLPSADLSCKRKGPLWNRTAADCGKHWRESPDSCEGTAICVHGLRPKVPCVKPHLSNVQQLLTLKPLVSNLVPYIFFVLLHFAALIFLINIPSSLKGENDYSSVYPLFGNPEKCVYKSKFWNLMYSFPSSFLLHCTFYRTPIVDNLSMIKVVENYIVYGNLKYSTGYMLLCL